MVSLIRNIEPSGRPVTPNSFKAVAERQGYTTSASDTIGNVGDGAVDLALGGGAIWDQIQSHRRLSRQFMWAGEGSAEYGVAAGRSQGTFRIVTANTTDEVDGFTARAIGRAIADDHVAYASYRQIQSTGRDVVLDFGPPPIPGATGIATGPNITLYMRNVDSVDEAVATIVHESNHAIRMHRRIASPFNQTRMDEYRAFRREFLFAHGRRPTFTEREQILFNLSQEPYYFQFPVGDVPNALRHWWVPPTRSGPFPHP